MKKGDYRDRSTVRKRLAGIVIFLTIVFLVLSIRLSYIMIVKRDEYSAKAIEQWTSEVKIDAKRGRILDRNGNELAVSANVYRVDFDLNSIRQYLSKRNLKHEDISPLIAEATGLTKEEVLKKLNTKLPSGADAGSANLVRRIEKTEADKVKDLKITGVIVSPDTKRYYPNGNFLSHVIGCTNIDGAGLNGIELKYNTQLAGTPGVRIAELDKRAEELPYPISSFTPPVDGKDVVLTIDYKMQAFAEKAANIALNDNKAKAATVIIMNPKNGEILAMANKPDFDPNTPYEGAENFEGDTLSAKTQKMWRNRAVSDTFEPGSIFKVITAISALEENVGVNDTYNCGGAKVFGKNRVKCWKAGGHGSQTFADVLKNSCNVGTMDIGAKVGKEKLNKYIKEFGFGKKTGVDLPGEAKGIVKSTESITEIDLATISFGQTNTVNPIQFMTAFNAVANGGTWIQPHAMKSITHVDENGKDVVDENFEPETRTVASVEKTKELREILERVVTEGSAKKCFIEGYRIGGKTGTAQKVNPTNGTYEAGKYISSFVAMAPVDDPKVTVMVSIDEPSAGEYYGGVICSPVARILFQDIFNYWEEDFDKADSVQKNIIIPEVRGLKVEAAKKLLKENNIEFEVEGEGDIITDISPKPGYKIKEGTKINLYTGEGTSYNKDVIVPNFSGYSKESAEKLLDSLGLKGEFNGSGLIDSQNLAAGEVTEKGTSIKFELSMDIND